MKYALEYDPIDQNTLTIHFDKELIESSVSPEEDMKAEATYECAAQGNYDTLVDDSKNDDDAELIFCGNINKDIISPCLKMMGNTIYSLKGVREVEICDYEIILLKSLFFEWKWIVDSVVATVLIFLEPDGKATETPFNQTGRKNKKGRKTKKVKTKTAEVSWKFQET